MSEETMQHPAQDVTPKDYRDDQQKKPGLPMRRYA